MLWGKPSCSTSTPKTSREGSLQESQLNSTFVNPLRQRSKPMVFAN
ncbi:hypothetical protein LINPERHAP1_LOCUS7503 [Linum perenne]